MNEPFAFYEKTAEYVKSRAPFAPELGLILGTGLCGFSSSWASNS